MSIVVYTDGGCAGNPGPGGWAYVIEHDAERRSASGGEAATTNNRMELTAVINALEAVDRDPQLRSRAVELHTDSQYVQKGMSEWISSWIAKGWVTAAKTVVKNKDLWQRLKAVSDRLKVEWVWVRGHVGVELNELCDQMVRSEIASLRTDNRTDNRKS